MEHIETLVLIGTEKEVLQWAKENGFTRAYSLYSYRSIKIETLINRCEESKLTWFVCKTDEGEFIAHNADAWNDDSLASEVYRFRKDK